MDSLVPGHFTLINPSHAETKMTKRSFICPIHLFDTPAEQGNSVRLLPPMARLMLTVYHLAHHQFKLQDIISYQRRRDQA
jgi:hypothetical protein